jgi:shikimate kinase
MPPILVVVGPPGAGKSTVGGVLAERLGVDFRDTDADVEKSAGMSVADIFVERGEAAFRELERAAVAEALASHSGVLALGGGAVLDPASRALLRGRTVIFLDVGLAEAVRRVGLARDRPLLLGNPRAQLLRLLEERRPLYQEVASETVSTDRRPPDDIADEVLARVRA